VTYYLVGVFGERIVAETGWSRSLVHGGFAGSLLVMGLVSAPAGRLVDRHGGRGVMAAGSVLAALGCAGLALAHSVVLYYAAWAVLGVAMRLTLYDAAFATLAGLGGAAAKRAMAEITLLGGLASTVFWPVGDGLAQWLGWRGAVLVYAVAALATLPLHLALPRGRGAASPSGRAPPPPPLASTPRDRQTAGLLYALGVTLTALLNAAMSAHMIGLLTGLGLAAATAVWIAAARGIGQSLARLTEILSGSRLQPTDLNLAASLSLPVAFAAALAGGAPAAALAFALLYGAGNGLLTITRGTLPLVLFDPATYGAVAGRLLVPGFLVSAAAPLAFAAVIDGFGEAAALGLAIALAVVAAGSALLLKLRFPRAT
jgi:MFS family permease